jgi:Putative zinc-finger
MDRCDEVLDRLEDAVAGHLDPDLAAHVAGCPLCQETVAAARATADGLRPEPLIAPRDLVDRIKGMRRLPPACEQAHDLLQRALDGEADAVERTALMAHLHACPTCRASWETCATLREVGALTTAPTGVRASLRAHPKINLVAHRPRHFIDLRLATAAAYLFAAVTVTLATNPTSLAREGTAQVETATLYARAAVNNRLDAYGARAKEFAASTAAWVDEKAHEGWSAVRRLFAHDGENRAASEDVEPGENGGPR